MLFKKVFLLFNFVGLLVYKLFFADAISITQKLPVSSEAGKDFVVELEINKGATAGFAKLQQDLPPGCTATVVDAAGGNFSFAEGTLKIIWMSLPPTPSYKVTYKLSVAKDATIGQIDLAGKFAYLENNEKKTYQIPVSSVSVVSKGEGTPIATTTKTEEPKATSTESNNSTSSSVASKETAQTTTATTETAPINTSTAAKTNVGFQNTTVTGASGNVVVTREMPNMAAKEFVVTVTIKKESINGFAKFEETLPDGMTALSIESASGVFSFVDHKVKYLWMSLPTDAEFKVSYKVTATPSFTGSTASIDGVFSFLENDETKKAIVAASGIQMGVDPSLLPASATTVAANTKVETTTPSATTTASSAKTPSTIQSSSSSQNEVATTTPPPSTKPKRTTSQASSSSSSSSASSAGIVFKVQVCATHKSVANTFFKDNWSVNEEIESEMHEGWYKYITGRFNQYSQARDKRTDLSTNTQIPGPFVTAYNNGSRITVQEALMIGGQQWVK